MKTVLQSLVIGAFVTLGLFGFAYLAVLMGYTELSYFFYWQGSWLQGFVPCNEVGTALYQTCEITRGHVIAFYAGLPFGAVLYAVPAYVILLVLKRRKTSR